MKYKEIERIILVFIILIILFSFIFISFYKWTKLSLILGFLAGASLSFIFFIFRELFSYKIVLYRKKGAIFLSFIQFTINAILTIGITTLIFWINSKSFENGTNLYLEHSKKYLFYPFNFITYIFGLSIVKISILFSLIKFKERRLKK